MKTYLDCIPCFLRQALEAARMSSKDETIHRRVLNAVALMIPDLALNATPPQIAQQVYRIVFEITGNRDPYTEAKKYANQSAMSLYARMKDVVDYSDDTLNKVATIISNGSDAPATILSQCSPKMRGYYQAADLIISKGQGNYESLSDRPENIFFLFKVKCPVIARDSGYDIDSPVLISSTVLKNAGPQSPGGDLHD